MFAPIVQRRHKTGLGDGQTISAAQATDACSGHCASPCFAKDRADEGKRRAAQSISAFSE